MPKTDDEMRLGAEEMAAVIQLGIDAAMEEVYARYPRSEFAVVVLAVPISRALLAESDPGTRAHLKAAINEMIFAALPNVEWPFGDPEFLPDGSGQARPA